MTAPISRIAMFHNRYGEPGGEDLSAAMETSLLRARGIQVLEYTASNRDLLEGPRTAAAAALWRSHFNRRVYEAVRRFCREHQPQVAHVQNFWFALSPSIHAACHDEGVATVQTLRNYRLLCVNAYLMRNGGPCEDCVGHVPWRGVLHACYRDSRLSSALVARMIQYNRIRGTWRHDVDVYVALTAFARSRFVAGGLPEERILLKPNTVEDPGPPTPPGAGAVFVGRLSPEKGIDLLLDAWQALPDVRLTIVGDGPLRGRVEQAAAQNPAIAFLGQRPGPECFDVIRRSALLVMASRWYEGFPRVIVEAYALGRAVVAPRLGSMADLVNGRTGLLFQPGSPGELARCVNEIVRDASLAREMSQHARAEYERSYTPSANVARLLEIYQEAVRHQSSR